MNTLISRQRLDLLPSVQLSFLVKDVLLDELLLFFAKI